MQQPRMVEQFLDLVILIAIVGQKLHFVRRNAHHFRGIKQVTS